MSIRLAGGTRLSIDSMEECGTRTYVHLGADHATDRLVEQADLTDWLGTFDAGVPPPIPPAPIASVMRLDGAWGDVPGVGRDAADSGALDRVEALLRAARPVAGVPEWASPTADGALRKQTQGAVMRSDWEVDFGGDRWVWVSATVDRCYQVDAEVEDCIEDADYASVGGAVVQAPGLVAALSALVPAWPGLTVALATVHAGEAVTVARSGIGETAEKAPVLLRPLEGDRPPVALGTAVETAGELRWTGTIPQSIAPGAYLVYVDAVGAELDLRPA